MTKKWQKKAEIFLSEQKNGKNFRSGSELQVLALPVLRECMRSGRTVAAVLPDSAGAEQLSDSLKAFAEKLGISCRMLSVPECGRGKLLFPGGESRRARALDALLNGGYDLVTGSISSLLGPAQAPGEVRVSTRVKVTTRTIAFIIALAPPEKMV